MASKSRRQPAPPATLDAAAAHESARALHAILSPSRLTSVVDVGANPIDGDPPYRRMLDERLCTVTGFEPQPAALAQLNADKGPLERYLPDVVGDGSDRVLRVTAASGMTSLFEPDPCRLELFNGFASFGAVLERHAVTTTKLDDVADLGAIDLLKIDVQGAELMVFQGGRERLSQAVAIHTEVSFVPLYKGQPTFGDIDVELRSQGFIPHAFCGVKQWMIAPMVFNEDPSLHLNQLLEADVVYVRDFARTKDMTVEQLQHLCLIAHYVYGSSDLVLHCLLALSARKAVPTQSSEEYLRSLVG